MRLLLSVLILAIVSWGAMADAQASDPDRIEVCSFATIPSGWKSIGTRWAPGRCDAGADSITQNVTVIKRQ